MGLPKKLPIFYTILLSKSDFLLSYCTVFQHAAGLSQTSKAFSPDFFALLWKNAGESRARNSVTPLDKFLDTLCFGTKCFLPASLFNDFALTLHIENVELRTTDKKQVGKG